MKEMPKVMKFTIFIIISCSCVTLNIYMCIFLTGFCMLKVHTVFMYSSRKLKFQT